MGVFSSFVPDSQLFRFLQRFMKYYEKGGGKQKLVNINARLYMIFLLSNISCNMLHI